MDSTTAVDAIAVATTAAASIGKEEAAQCSPFYIQVTISHTTRIRYTYFRKKNHIY